MTKYAEEILNIVNESTDHLTAEQIYLKLKENSSKAVLATVYNNLNQLHEKGMIRKVTVEGSPERYDKTIKHDHMICKKCGHISDITLKDLTKDIKSQTGEEVLSYDLKISYICPECRAK